MKLLKPLALVTIIIALIVTFCACQSEAERYYSEAVALKEQGEDIEALLALEKTLDLDINDADYLAKRASLYSELGDFEQAIEDYSNAINMEPEAEYYNARALNYTYMREFEKAIADYNVAINLDPLLDEAYLWRGKCHHLLGQYELFYETRDYEALSVNAKEHYELALEDINEAIRLNPDAVYYAVRALVYIDMEQYEKAISDYDEAINIEPKASYFEYRAGLHFLIGQYQQAIIDCDEAIRLEPQNPSPYLFRGTSYTELGQYEKAIDDLSESINIMPLPLTYILRADAYIGLGQYDNAVEDYNEAIALQSNLTSDETLDDMREGPLLLQYYVAIIERVKQSIEEFQANDK